MSSRTASAAAVQSRCEGVLKSPVMNVGIPRRSAGRNARSVWRISGSRVARSFAITRARERPSRTRYGPYGSEVRCTLASANTRPGETCASTYSPRATGGSISG